MQSLYDKPGPDSSGTSSGDHNGFTDPDGRKVNNRSIILQANTIPITTILKHYGHHVDEYNRRIRCPFHNERSPSFWWYSNSNRFFCFGCKVSGGPVEFVAITESINKLDAALKLIEGWGSSLSSGNDLLDNNIINNDKSILEFSDYIRQFIIKHESTLEVINYVEKLCYSFDKMNQKYQLTEESFKALVDKIKSRLENY